MTDETRNERTRALAHRQCGRVTVAQLQQIGMAPWIVARWIEQGHLQKVLPRVYAVGHTAPSWEGELWAAVLYAGPGAMLSHVTAARWRGLIDYAPSRIQVSTPRHKRSRQGINVFPRRSGLERAFHKGIPVTSIPTTMVDLAATDDARAVHRALGQLDFQQLLDVNSLLAACGRGRQGATALRAAIDDYDPRAKYTNRRLEEEFYALCKRRRLPLPLLNFHVHEIKCDAYWPDQGLVVELDGRDGHSSPAQQRRDRRNDMALRAHGLTVLRYDWQLVHKHPGEVCRDVLLMLERLIAERRGAVGEHADAARLARVSRP
jgi:predicted transcriptional regulator of viral defense system